MRQRSACLLVLDNALDGSARDSELGHAIVGALAA
jgi:hypothetical protein